LYAYPAPWRFLIMINTTQKQKRPPVVAVMGHVDHGKSSLLDYIRSTNVIDGEAGGITQHISAYEVEHENESGEKDRITFIDTPGHAAFSGMRSRGATMADIVILIVSAEDGVKEQTKEAIDIIQRNKVPMVVAINKIDKNNADPEKVKYSLLEHGVYLEGLGGDIPYSLISAKKGTGISELLDTLLLMAEMEEFTGNPETQAEGFVVESSRDVNRGISATLIIKNGSLSKGNFVVAGKSIASTRLLEDFSGKSIESAAFSSPIRITGFDTLPEAGALFMSFTTKKEAETTAHEQTLAINGDYESRTKVNDDEERFVLPLIIKSDVVGTKEAIETEVEKLTNEKVLIKIIKSEAGNITENDIHLALTNPNSIIISFNGEVEKTATRVDGYDTVTIKKFNVIYHLTEWLEKEIEERRPKKNVNTTTSSCRVIKIFNKSKGQQLIGCKVHGGTFQKDAQSRLIRNEKELCLVKISEMKSAHQDVASVPDGQEFGMMVISQKDIEEGDIVENFITEID
jgi:translation initiation factor IF-2